MKPKRKTSIKNRSKEKSKFKKNQIIKFTKALLKKETNKN